MGPDYCNYGHPQYCTNAERAKLAVSMQSATFNSFEKKIPGTRYAAVQ